jgi:signal transduction histidine kinase
VKPSRRLRLPLVAVLAAGTLIALVSVSVLTMAVLISNRPVINQSRQFLAALDRARDQLVDAETAQRGFLLTSDEEYLRPLASAPTVVMDSLAEAHRLIGEARLERDRIADLQRVASDKLREIATTVELVRRGQAGAAVAIVRSNLGRSLMDSARVLVAEVHAAEDRRLAEHTASARRRLDLAMWIDAAAGLGVLALGFVLFAINRDIARRVELERALREVSAFQQQFMGILGHDLRTPLTAISVTADLLERRGRLAPDQREALDRIAAGAQRMNRMVEQLLDITRARMAGGIPVEPTPGANLTDIVKGVVEELRVAHPATAIALRADPDVRGEWDRDRLAQVASNLVGNGVHHGAGQPVEVHLLTRDGFAILEVHNRGPAIPRELLGRVFEPFRRASGGGRGSRSSQGLGLGLFISDQIVRAHGGRIDVASTEADGTTFTVTLPVAARGRAEAPADQPARLGAAAPATRG